MYMSIYIYIYINTYINYDVCIRIVIYSFDKTLAVLNSYGIGLRIVNRWRRLRRLMLGSRVERVERGEEVVCVCVCVCV